MATAVVVIGPFSSVLSGLSFDSMVWLRQAVVGPTYPRAESPTVVIAIDEETYRRKPFRNLPKVMWTNEFATVFDAVADGGAAVLGMDIIFPTTVESKIRGFDRAFLQSLRRNGYAGRFVLSKVQHSADPILPSVGQRFAVGHGANIRAVNLYSDKEGIVRGVPTGFLYNSAGAERVFEPSFAFELAARALGERLVFDDITRVSRDGELIPVVDGRNMLINFDDSQAGIPTYSMADLLACAETGNTDFFERHFADRVVLIGGVLDLEDRKLSSLRFTAEPDVAAFTDRCILEPLPGLMDPNLVRDTLPGVYLHAFAINNLIRGNFLSDVGLTFSTAATFLFVLIVTFLALWISAWLAGLITLGLATGWFIFALCAYDVGWLLPLFDPPIAAAIGLFVMIAYRFTVSDRDKRMLRQMFGLYLAPSVIEQMVERSEMPALGGETRELTVYFSDLAGFTALSEGMAPDKLVGLLNNYLSEMTEIIEEHNGFVDKYIGDAIVAIFGAPRNDAAHSENAVKAAIECQTRLEALNLELNLSDGVSLRQRIGVNTGKVLVGNIGSSRRFNYTVIGDAVNLASRLEEANKYLGTSILISNSTHERCKDSFGFREIDRVRVLGREDPVTVFTPVENDLHSDTTELYGTALTEYYEGRFIAAAQLWATIADVDPPAAAMAKRARDFVASPPTNWDGVYNLLKK